METNLVRKSSIWKMAALLILFFCTQLGCPRPIPAEYKDVLFKPVEEKQRAFNRLSIEKQIEVCIFAQHLEPPDPYLRSFVSGKGKEVVPFLLSKLNSEGISDRDRQIVINLLREIHVFHYALNNSEDVHSSIRRAISQMSDPFWKKLSEEDLQRITAPK